MTSTPPADQPDSTPAVPPTPAPDAYAQPVAPGPVGETPALPPVAPVLPPENRLRGFLLALIAAPVGVILYVIVFNLGYIAWIVAFAVAFGAFFLYKKGSGGRISVPGGFIVAAITLVTLVVGFVIAESGAISTAGLTWEAVFKQPENMAILAGDFGLTALFGVIAAGLIVVTAFRESRTQNAPAAPSPLPPAPGA